MRVADDAADTEEEKEAVEEEAGAGVAGPRPPLSLPPPEAAGAFRRVLMAAWHHLPLLRLHRLQQSHRTRAASSPHAAPLTSA